MKETSQHKEAFEYYISLGFTRSVKKVADHFGISRVSVNKWCNAFNWKERAKERDNKTLEELRIANDEAMRKKLETYRNVLTMSITDYIKNLKGGSVKIETVGDLVKLMKLDIDMFNIQDARYELNSKKVNNVSEESVNTFKKILNDLNTVEEPEDIEDEEQENE